MENSDCLTTPSGQYNYSDTACAGVVRKLIRLAGMVAVSESLVADSIPHRGTSMPANQRHRPYAAVYPSVATEQATSLTTYYVPRLCLGAGTLSGYLGLR